MSSFYLRLNTKTHKGSIPVSELTTKKAPKAIGNVPYIYIQIKKNGLFNHSFVVKSM